MKNEKQKWLPVLLSLTGIMSFAGAVYLSLRVVREEIAPYQRIFGMIIGGLLLLLSILVGYYLFLCRDTEPNFFLFDRKKRKNVSPEELTFTRINERMTFLMCQISETPEKLWSGETLLHEDELFGYRSVYKPLVAYKMVYDMGTQPEDSGYWEYAHNANPTALQAWKEALMRAGEKQFAETFLEILQRFPRGSGKLQEYVKRNMGYLRKRMSAYVLKHIELFY